MNDLIPADDQNRFAEAVRAIQQPRTDFELAHFVVGQHEATPRQWAQCTLELQLKIQNLRRAKIKERQILRRITRLEEKGTDVAIDRAELLKLDLEDQALAVIGAVREVQALYALWQSMPTFSREELNAAEPEYWRQRLARQASQEVNAFGRIGVGNQDALRMAGMAIPGQPNYIQQVEQRFLEAGKVRILVATPTLIPQAEIEAKGLACLQGWTIPATIERRKYVITGKSIADAYTDAALTAMQDNADFILTVEDDHVIPPGSFERLWSVYQQYGPRAIVGAWYPQKTVPRRGAPIVIRNGRRDYLQLDGDGSAGDGESGVCEVFAIPQGFTLIPTGIFRDLPQPWFATTGSLTQDSFFSQLAREAGYKLLVDTDCRIKHVCRETGRVYE
jgi:hypothetical protein